MKTAIGSYLKSDGDVARVIEHIGFADDSLVRVDRINRFGRWHSPVNASEWEEATEEEWSAAIERSIEAMGKRVGFVVTILGPPNPARVNNKMIVARGRLVKSAGFRKWLVMATETIAKQANGQTLDGPLHASVTAYWPRIHRTGSAESLPFGDVDAVAKAVLDAFEQSGAIHSDAQVTRVSLEKKYDPKEPRIVARIWKATK